MFSHELPYKIIESTNPHEILAKLIQFSKTGAHFTNGTFAFNSEVAVPTTIAGFKYALEQNPDLPLIIAINSDESMRQLGKTDFKDQKTRAHVVAQPLAEAFPKNKVIIIFYDETTPNKLYELLAFNKITFSLYKWGYGTTGSAPKIEGAELFEHVFAFETLESEPNPACWNVTPIVDQKHIINVVNLYGNLLTAEHKCLFKLPERLQVYQDESVSVAMKAGVS